MASIHVRLFFYGLIAFVDRPPLMHVLLMDHRKATAEMDQHTPFVVFGGGGCKDAPCPSITIEGVDWTGWALDGENIDVPGITSAVESTIAAPPRANRQLVSPAPNSPAEAEDFAWVPKMSDILGKPPGFDEGCLPPDPRQCGRVKLAGAATLRVTSLASCDLVRTNDTCTNPDAKIGVDEYAFFPHLHPEATVQALAEVVVLEADVPADAGGYLTITLTTFDGATKRMATVKPKNCQGKQCIDIFVGNVPPKVPGDPDCPGRARGAHFAFYYDLLVDPPFPKPIPTANGIAKPNTVRSRCATGIIFPIPEALTSAHGDESFGVGLLSVNSRPVCAMTVF